MRFFGRKRSAPDPIRSIWRAGKDSVDAECHANQSIGRAWTPSRASAPCFNAVCRARPDVGGYAQALFAARPQARTLASCRFGRRASCRNPMPINRRRRRFELASHCAPGARGPHNGPTADRPWHRYEPGGCSCVTDDRAFPGTSCGPHHGRIRCVGWLQVAPVGEEKGRVLFPLGFTMGKDTHRVPNMRAEATRLGLPIPPPSRRQCNASDDGWSASLPPEAPASLSAGRASIRCADRVLCQSAIHRAGGRPIRSDDSLCFKGGRRREGSRRRRKERAQTKTVERSASLWD